MDRTLSLGEEASKTIIKADPILGSLLIIAIIAIAYLLYSRIRAADETTRIAMDSFNTLSKVASESTKVVAQAQQNYESIEKDIQRLQTAVDHVHDKFSTEYPKMRGSLDALKAEVTEITQQLLQKVTNTRRRG